MEGGNKHDFWIVLCDEDVSDTAFMGVIPGFARCRLSHTSGKAPVASPLPAAWPLRA